VRCKNEDETPLEEEEKKTANIYQFPSCFIWKLSLLMTILWKVTLYLIVAAGTISKLYEGPKIPSYTSGGSVKKSFAHS
jgi:hypothetical protein